MTQTPFPAPNIDAVREALKDGQNLAENFLAYLAGEHGLHFKDVDDHNVEKFLAWAHDDASAALALLDEKVSEKDNG